MKSFKSVITKATLMLALTSATGSFSPIQAQVQQVLVNETDNIRFINMEGDMLVFELRLKEPLLKGSTIRVLDGQGNIIFEERTNADTYSVRYKIVRNDMDKIAFEISNKRFSLNQSFNISSRVEEKIEVTRV